ncbi:deoxyribonuclease IV [Candidatus Parcubacteria bacterium]|nr:deoxyribonuclease IV [Candidatus Parcubacteria bacterium]
MIYGLHISTAGDLVGTPKRARDMGAEVMQIFAGSPRTWRPSVYDDAQTAAFRQACREAGIQRTFIHMIYLVSYGTPDDALRGKSITALSQMLATADQLGAAGVVTHLGSHKGLGLEQALQRLAAALQEALEASSNSWLILENSAGAGGNIGNCLEELAMIIEAMDHHPRLKVCLDTAHLLASGYEIRSAGGMDRLITDFERLIGLDRLSALHLNDSKADLGAKVDRHENIGDGYIGRDGFKVIINHPKLKDVPGMLEVPGLDGKGPDAANLQRLKDLTN